MESKYCVVATDRATKVRKDLTGPKTEEEAKKLKEQMASSRTARIYANITVCLYPYKSHKVQ